MENAADLLSVDLQSGDAARRFGRSVRDTGFAVLRNHGVAFSAVRAAYAAWQRFFESPDKHDYEYRRETQDGYYSAAVSEVALGHTQKDLKEFFHFHVFGRHPEPLRAPMLQVYAPLLALAQTLLRWLEEAAPCGTFYQTAEALSAMLADSPDTVLRILRYPPLCGSVPADAMRAAPHADISLLSLLPAATATGLEVCDPQGAWRPVPCESESIIVNGGDILQLCSGGYYRSARHRVVNPRDEAAHEPRLSMVLFVHPHAQTRLSEEHTAGSYLRARLQQIKVL